MAERYWKKLALLAKLEDTYGTDATPTGVANAMLGTDVSFTPLAGGEAKARTWFTIPSQRPSRAPVSITTGTVCGTFS